MLLLVCFFSLSVYLKVDFGTDQGIQSVPFFWWSKVSDLVSTEEPTLGPCLTLDLPVLCTLALKMSITKANLGKVR